MAKRWPGGWFRETRTGRIAHSLLKLGRITEGERAFLRSVRNLDSMSQWEADRLMELKGKYGV